METQFNGAPVTCDCGKLIAIERNGKIYVKCRRCKREIEVSKAREPRTPEVKSH